MVGSKGTQNPTHRRLRKNLMESTISEVSCSICLELVCHAGGRSRAKLQCGHEFHLDCIGSAFNMKGSMQCPNCRKVENGEWLYSTGSNRYFPEMSTEERTPDEDFYDPYHLEMPFRNNLCPYDDMARTESSFEDIEFTSIAYHDGVQDNHALISEAATPASTNMEQLTRPMPRFNDADDFNVVGNSYFNQRWNGWSGVNGEYRCYDCHPDPVPPATLRPSHAEINSQASSRYYSQSFDYGVGSSQGPSLASRNRVGGAQTQVSPAAIQLQPQPQPQPPTNAPPGMQLPSSRRSMPTAPVNPHQPEFYIFHPSVSSREDVNFGENSGWGNEDASRFSVEARDSNWDVYTTSSSSDSFNWSSSSYCYRHASS